MASTGGHCADQTCHGTVGVLGGGSLKEVVGKLECNQQEGRTPFFAPETDFHNPGCHQNQHQNAAHHKPMGQQQTGLGGIYLGNVDVAIAETPQDVAQIAAQQGQKRLDFGRR